MTATPNFDGMTELLEGLRHAIEAAQPLQLDIDGNAHEITVPKATRRHPAEVTAERLATDYERHYDKLTPAERGDMERTMDALREIASGER